MSAHVLHTTCTTATCARVQGSPLDTRVSASALARGPPALSVRTWLRTSVAALLTVRRPKGVIGDASGAIFSSTSTSDGQTLPQRGAEFAAGIADLGRNNMGEFKAIARAVGLSVSGLHLWARREFTCSG